MIAPVILPSCGGTYILLLELAQSVAIRIGKLGRFDFPVGWYVYVGSAFGPGGLRARLGRHIRRQKKKRWHIDYLLAHASICEVWYTALPEPREHQWAHALGQVKGTAIAVRCFGSSDCVCETHLFHFSCKPESKTLKTALVATLPDGLDIFTTTA
jgi:Uri superfamily endonuclease